MIKEKKLTGNNPVDSIRLERKIDMRIYLFFNQIPEFKKLSGSEQSKIIKDYYLKSFLHWGHWLGFGLFVVCILIWDWLVEDFLPVILKDYTPEKIKLVFLIVFLAVGGFLYGQVVTQTMRHIYRRDLNIEHD